MKKILLGSTGLVAVALLASAASAAETPKVTLGGFSDFQAGFTEDDKDANTRSQAFRNDNTLTVKVDGKTNALGYGAEIDLNADTTASADSRGTEATRTFTYLDGAFGRAEMGDVNSVAGAMRVDASSIATATGGINGAWTYFVNGSRSSAGFLTTSRLYAENGLVSTDGDSSTFNSTKLNYYTPKFAGFQGGISYTPSLTRGQTFSRADNSASAAILTNVAAFDNIQNIWDFALAYEGTFSGVKVAAAGTYETADGETSATKDVNAWNLGASLGYQGFSLAGSYGDLQDSGRTASNLDTSDYWTLGGAYAAGPVSVSATYLQSQYSATSTTENEFNNIVLGAEYKLAAGLTPYAEVSFYDFDSTGTTYDNEGTTFILGTQVAF